MSDISERRFNCMEVFNRYKFSFREKKSRNIVSNKDLVKQ